MTADVNERDDSIIDAAQNAWALVQQWPEFVANPVLADLAYNVMEAYIGHKVDAQRYPQADVNTAAQAFLKGGGTDALLIPVYRTADEYLKRSPAYAPSRT